MFRCSSFRLHEGVAYQCALTVHPDDPAHIALTRKVIPRRDDEQWGLLVWTSEMAYRGYEV